MASKRDRIPVYDHHGRKLRYLLPEEELTDEELLALAADDAAEWQRELQRERRRN